MPGLDQKNGLKQQFSFDDSHPVPLIDAKHGLLKTKVLVFFLHLVPFLHFTLLSNRRDPHSSSPFLRSMKSHS